MTTIYEVFGIPLPRPTVWEFLGAYTTQARAQAFVDAQDPDVRQHLKILDITLDVHPPSDFWKKLSKPEPDLSNSRDEEIL